MRKEDKTIVPKYIKFSSIIPFPGYTAMTLFNWIIFRKEYKDKVIRTFKGKIWNIDTYTITSIINHEKIHLKQWKETLYLFPFIYFVEWLIRVMTPPWRTAYVDISFEREAYTHEKSANYLAKRKPFAWIKYWFKVNKTALHG